MNARLLTLFSAAILALGFAACGDDDGMEMDGGAITTDGGDTGMDGGDTPMDGGAVDDGEVPMPFDGGLIPPDADPRNDGGEVISGCADGTITCADGEMCCSGIPFPEEGVCRPDCG